MSLDHRTITSEASAPIEATSAWNAPIPLRMRPHNLLCLQGWEGMGYSPRFTATMNAIHAHLQQYPQTLVTLVEGPDQLCEVCPLLQEGSCWHDAMEEGWITAQDARTLARLALPAGATHPWATLETAIAAAFAGPDLASHCAHCRWQPLGVCAAGLDRLRTRLAHS